MLSLNNNANCLSQIDHFRVEKQTDFDDTPAADSRARQQTDISQLLVLPRDQENVSSIGIART